jgi:hypothetical protein
MINTWIVHISAHDINVVFDSYHIVSWELWQPLVDMCWHLIRVTLDIGHVEGFVEVSCSRASHWSKGKGFMEKSFSNRRLERMPSLVNLRRLEFPGGERLGERKFLGRWSCQMSFKMSSSKRVEREHPLGGVGR